MGQNKPLPARIIFLFQKYTNNDCSSEELHELLEGISNPSFDKHLDIIMHSIWESIKRNDNGSITDEDEKQLKKEAQELINKANTVAVKPVNKIFTALGFRNIAAAAIIILFMGVGLTFFFTNESTSSFLSWKKPVPDTYYKSGDTDIKTVRLADGSEITLNSGTSISYIKDDFNKDQREVWLKGEAFFEVTKNPEKPFIVHYGAMQTTVLGTSFNISAYPQVNKNIVSVKSGKVQVSDTNKTLGVLTKNNELIYETANGKSSVRSSKWQDATGWMEGNLVFRESGKEEIKVRLQHYFDVTVEVKGNALADANTSLNAAFAKGSTIEEVLKTISLLAGSKYTIESKKVTIYN